MSATIKLEAPDQNSLNQYLAIAIFDTEVLDIAAGATAILALDAIRELYPEAEISEEALQAAREEMFMPEVVA